MTHYATYLAVYRFLRNFRPKYRIFAEKGSFLVKTAENWAELEQVLKLRHEVFHEEFIGRKLPLGIDVDRLDPVGDHLVIQDKRTGKIVGTYRLICSSYSKQFYSESEFNLEGFLGEPGVKLELSRACIHADYRDGIVIALLWRGLVQYIQQSASAYLFGCASIRSMNASDIQNIYRYLSVNGHCSDQYGISPTNDYVMPGFTPPDGTELPDAAKSLIPPLLNSYLRAGAKVCGAPALDRDFQCVDLFTVLKMKELSSSYERKYTPTLE